MLIFRLLVAWLIMAALPLQGLAAASMLYCDQTAAAVATTLGAYEAHAEHDHHQPSAHGHDGHAADHADAADHANADHKCPICALCQVVAIPEYPPLLAWADPPSADLPQPRVPALTRAPPRPDKPPRA